MVIYQFPQEPEPLRQKNLERKKAESFNPNHVECERPLAILPATIVVDFKAQRAGGRYAFLYRSLTMLLAFGAAFKERFLFLTLLLMALIYSLGSLSLAAFFLALRLLFFKKSQSFYRLSHLCWTSCKKATVLSVGSTIALFSKQLGLGFLCLYLALSQSTDDLLSQVMLLLTSKLKPLQ